MIQKLSYMWEHQRLSLKQHSVLYSRPRNHRRSPSSSSLRSWTNTSR